MTKYTICDSSELDEGDRISMQIEGKDITVFNLKGEFYAYTNWCTHQGGPACGGKITGAVTAEFDKESLETTTTLEQEGEILRCPWHAWEFDIKTGECLIDDSRLISHQVTVNENNEIEVEV